jgi:hypothetical protein
MSCSSETLVFTRLWGIISQNSVPTDHETGWAPRNSLDVAEERKSLAPAESNHPPAIQLSHCISTCGNIFVRQFIKQANLFTNHKNMLPYYCMQTWVWFFITKFWSRKKYPFVPPPTHTNARTRTRAHKICHSKLQRIQISMALLYWLHQVLFLISTVILKMTKSFYYIYSYLSRYLLLRSSWANYTDQATTACSRS